ILLRRHAVFSVLQRVTSVIHEVGLGKAEQSGDTCILAFSNAAISPRPKAFRSKHMGSFMKLSYQGVA
ncbi:MAG: hypothetical protein AAGK71_11370, partial [Pseudomonadota bacterium]